MNLRVCLRDKITQSIIVVVGVNIDLVHEGKPTQSRQNETFLVGPLRCGTRRVRGSQKAEYSIDEGTDHPLMHPPSKNLYSSDIERKNVIRLAIQPSFLFALRKIIINTMPSHSHPFSNLIISH